MNEEQLSRFVAKVKQLDGGCWEWTAARLPSGYGQFRRHRDPDAYAHRWSYRYFVGEIADGYHVDHLCGNKWCVNPTHLEAVAPEQNARRGGEPHHEKLGVSLEWAERTHCRNGHEAGDWYVVSRSNGIVSRVCKKCHLATIARWRQRKVA